MKTKFSLATVLLFLIFLGTSYNLKAQGCTQNCPPTPPYIFHDGGKGDPIFLSKPVCYWPDNQNEVGISVTYKYRPSTHPVLPNKVTFNFVVEDLQGNPLTVHYPSSASNNTFLITIFVSQLTSVPSGPYNAYIDSNNEIFFDLDYNTDLPPGYPTDLTLKTYVTPTEYKSRTMTVGLQTWFYLDICDPNQSSRQGSFDKSEELKAMPNPFSDYLELHISGQESVEPQIQLFDMKGQKIDRSATLKYAGNEEWIGAVNTQTLPDGIYLYRIRIGNKVISGKVIKQ